METLRTETADGVCSIVLTRAAEYNTITPALRDELAAAIDEADADPAARVILLRAEGPGVLRRLRARLVDRGPGRGARPGAGPRRRRAPRVGLGRGLALHEDASSTST